MTRSSLSRITAAALMATALTALSGSAVWAQAVEAGPGLSAASLKEQEAFAIARDAYIYGYPLVTMEMTRRVITNVAQPSGSHAPMGQVVSLREYPTATYRDVTAPNADTLYTAGFVDVGQEPYVISLPDMNGRYFLFPMLSAWTNVIADPGKRTTGTGPQSYAITGPNWRGTLPNGVKEIKSPTSMVWILGRIYSTGTPEDYRAVWALQDQIKLVPLSAYGRPYTPPAGKVDSGIDMKTSVRKQVNRLEPGPFFSLLAQLMKDNPPPAEDAPILARMAKIGIVPGHAFDTDQLDPEIAKGVERAHRAGWEEIAGGVRAIGEIENGWMVATTLGRYGIDYPKRATVAAFGLGANLPQDAVYPVTSVDSSGRKLTGTEKYVLHFDKGQLPPVEGFWSLTMYDSQFFFVGNPLNRYTLSERNRLAQNPDGSIDRYLQNESPGAGKEDNWLPAPKGDMNLMLRLYWPKETAPSILNGTWKPPKIERAEERSAADQTRMVPTSASIPATTGSASTDPIAGSSTIGVAITDVRVLYSGFSVKNQILGREIYNDKGERIGHVADLIVAPDKTATYAIVGTGGFLNLGEHLTAVPVSQFTFKDGDIVLPNATKRSLEAMPRFVRASNE
ncbi:DUF1254 domain-containing protein [Microvirga calopogonii]|uniref:DUF1254 domain-containing protein n=1 Tax=Microvirga calopogonii TaxID=2078013 RepID=UPI00197C301B